MIMIYINNIWAAYPTEVEPSISQNKHNIHFQPLPKARDLPNLDVANVTDEINHQEDYPMFGKAISDNRIRSILRKTSNRRTRSTSIRTYPNRVTYVASNRGKIIQNLNDV